MSRWMFSLFLILAVAAAGMESASAQSGAFERTGVVLSTLRGGGYTYLEVQTSRGRYWAAVPEMNLSAGDRVDVAPGNEMRNFSSSSLKRSFESIIFTSSVKVIGKTGSPDKEKTPSAPAPPAKSDSAGKGIRTVAELYANRDSLKGQQVQVRGRVIKFSPGIMGKNFVHIQDGSGQDGNNDLTVTTQEAVQVGDRVVVSGTLGTDKNFGAGYSYKVILEEATLQKE